MSPTHDDGSRCTAHPSLAALPAAEIATALESLPGPHRHHLDSAAGLGSDVGPFARKIVARVPTLTASEAHEVARWLVQPLIPTFAESLESTDDAGWAIREGVSKLFEEWPPGLVLLLIELAWEVGQLPADLLDRQALDHIARLNGHSLPPAADRVST